MDVRHPTSTPTSGPVHRSRLRVHRTGTRTIDRPWGPPGFRHSSTHPRPILDDHRSTVQSCGDPWEWSDSLDPTCWRVQTFRCSIVTSSNPSHNSRRGGLCISTASFRWYHTGIAATPPPPLGASSTSQPYAQVDPHVLSLSYDPVPEDEWEPRRGVVRK